MSKKLAVANGNYQKDGQEKTRWVNVGVILEKNGKEFMLVDPTINFAAFPREEGKDMVMVGIFEEQQNNQQQGGNNNYQQPQQQQSYQQPQQAPTQYVNAQNQITDANGQLILLNGQPQYAQQ